MANCGESSGFALELYISYDDLGLDDPDSIKLCFNFNNVSLVSGAKSAEDNYLTKAGGTEENIESYFEISELIK